MIIPYIYITGFFIIFMNHLFNDVWFICPNMDSVNELNVCKALGRPTSLKLAWICLRSPKPTSCSRGNITAIRHSNQSSSCIFHRRKKHNAPTHTKHDETLSDYMITLNPTSVFNWLSEGLTIPGPMKKIIHVIVLSPNIPRVSSWASEQSQYTRWSNHTFGQTISSIWNPRKADDWSSLINKKLGAFFNDWNTSLDDRTGLLGKMWTGSHALFNPLSLLIPRYPAPSWGFQSPAMWAASRAWRFAPAPDAQNRIFFAASSSLCK